ncbi:MAG: hypothetical protein Q4G10_02825 [Bacteroidia bacterium]|nr:hypothetical protein [Bacteroidia bacterium]
MIREDYRRYGGKGPKRIKAPKWVKNLPENYQDWTEEQDEKYYKWRSIYFRRGYSEQEWQKFFVLVPGIPSIRIEQVSAQFLLHYPIMEIMADILFKLKVKDNAVGRTDTCRFEGLGIIRGLAYSIHDNLVL